jgi:hypothetical protein
MFFRRCPIFLLLIVVICGLNLFSSIKRSSRFSKIKLDLAPIIMSGLDENQLSKQERERFKESLNGLQGDLDGGFLTFQRKFKVFSFVTYLDMILADDVFERSDYLNWIKRYDSRKTLSRSELKAYFQ